MSNIRSKSAHFLAPRIKNNRDQTESKHTTYEGSENMLKWKQIARQVCEQIQLSTYATRGPVAHKSFDKFGNASFSLRKCIIKQNNVSVDTAQLTSSHSTNILNAGKTLQQYRITQKGRKNIKRTSRPFNEVKSNMQHDRIVLKIGSHMQYEQKFIMSYIQNIKKVQMIEPTPMPIIFCIKSETETYNACMTSFRNEQIPICISLFSQSFHAKNDQSESRKKMYIQKMIRKMNGTYDPQIMSNMPLINRKSALDTKKYLSNLPKFKSIGSSQQRKIIQQTFDKIINEHLSNFNIEHNKIKRLKQEMAQNYEIGSAIVNMDYYLKDPQNLKALGMLRQYLVSSKQHIASDRILYHGGYSKGLYGGWANYVKQGRSDLPKKVSKLSDRVQQINEWVQNFKDLSFIELPLMEVLFGALSLNQLKCLQLNKIEDTFGIVNQICMKGVLTILQVGKFLYRQYNQYQDLLKTSTKYNYLAPTDPTVKRILLVNLQSQTELLNWFKNFLRLKHKTSTLQSYEQLVPAKINMNSQISESERKKVKKSIEILLSIFYQQITSRSLTRFIEFFATPIKPYIRLKIIVDRQSLRLEESEEEVIDTFDKIISCIVHQKIQVSAAGLKLEEVDTPNCSYQEYGNLTFVDINQQTTRANAGWQFHIQYKNFQNIEAQYSTLLGKIKQWYHISQMVIQNFNAFLPFIKLTAKEKIFVQEQDLKDLSEWDQAKQLFVVNKEKVLSYRQKLSQIPLKFSIGIFEVDCSQPHKILKDRILQIEYLFQQKYLSRVFQKIHEMEQDLGRIMTTLHSLNINVNKAEDIADMFERFKDELLELKRKTKELAKHISFYVERQAKSNTLITRFTQLVNKRRDLLLQIEDLRQKMKEQSYSLEIKREEQKVIFNSKIETFKQRLINFSKQFIEISKLERHLNVMRTLKQEFNQFREEFKECKDPNYDYHKEESLLNQIDTKIAIVFKYWQSKSQFKTMVRELNWGKVRNVNMEEFSRIIENNQEVVTIFEQTKFELNPINMSNFIRFREEIIKYKRQLEFLKILADHNISIDYYDKFGCEELLSMNMKAILELPNWQSYKPKLKELEIKANAQQKILSKYNAILDTFKSLRLTIIDLQGVDTLDPELTKELAETLQNSAFECQILLQCKYSDKFKASINELAHNMLACEQIMLRWLEVENKFIQLEAFYKNNDDAYLSDNFRQISESHRKIIKSFDMDNSVLLLPSNTFLSRSLSSSLAMMSKLKNELFQQFNELQSKISRLKLLTHDELLEMMSIVKVIPKHLPKCFPSIVNFGLSEQSIDRVGGYSIFNAGDKLKKEEKIVGNYIQLREPFNLGSRLASVETWLDRLINDIKQNLRLKFLIPNKKQSCLQILLLKEQIEFTESVERIFQSEENTTKKFDSFLHSIQIKFQQKLKSDIPKHSIQMLLLTLILQRDTVGAFAQSGQVISRDSFEWLKLPRFYHNHAEQEGKKYSKIDIKMEVVNEVYQYNFMFLQHCDFVIHDTIFIGNCIIGSRGIGKKSIIKNYAYLTGNELFEFESDRISSDFTENIINYFKLAITTGGWLVVSQIDRMSSEQMRAVAECLSYLNQAIASKLKKMEMFVYNPFNVNDNCRVFFTLENFNSIPARLAHNFRPVWVCAPSLQFMNDVYNEVSQLLYNKNKNQILISGIQNFHNTFKIADFIYWNSNHQEIPLCLTSSLLLQGQKFNDSNHSQNGCNSLNFLVRNKFLMPKDVGHAFAGEQNIDQILQKQAYSIFYMPEREFTNFLLSNFIQENVLIFRISSCSIAEMKQIFNHVKSALKRKQIKQIIFQNSLKFYQSIQKQMICDSLINSYNIRVVFLQSLLNLQSQANLRLQINFPTAVLELENPVLYDSKEASQKFRKIPFKSVYTGQQEQLQLDSAHKKFIQLLISKFIKNKKTNEDFEQNLRWFGKLYSKLIDQGHCKEVAFVFSLSWTISNIIPQNIILQELNNFDPKFALHKIYKTCANLKQLYPLKNSFVNNSDLLSEVHQFKYSEESLKLKSIVLSNIKLIRRVLKNEIFVLKCESQTEQILNTLFNQSIHLYPCDMESPLIAKKLLQHILKVKTQQNTPHFVIHLADKLHLQTFDFIRKLSEKGFAMFEQAGELKLFKQRKCHFTFSVCKFNQVNNNAFLMYLDKQEVISIESDQIASIIRLAQPNKSQDENIIKGIMQYYRSNFSKFYWLQQPIRHAIKKCLREGEAWGNFPMWFIRYLFISIPQEKVKIMNQICYFSAPVSLLKSYEQEYQIKMTNLAQTHSYLEERISKSEIEIKKNLCKDLIVMNQNFNAIQYTYEMLYRTFLAISESHAVLLGCTFTQRYYCLEAAAKILNVDIIPFHLSNLNEPAKQSTEKKNVLLLSDTDIMSDFVMTSLECQIVQQNSALNKNYVVVIKLNNEGFEAQAIYQKYPFIKKYFVNVHFVKNCKEQITKNVNLVKTLKLLENGQNKYELSMLNDWEVPPEIQIEKNIGQYFEGQLQKNFGFLVRLLQYRRQFEEQQFNKYRFYRSLTEQLFHIVAQLRDQINDIPERFETIKSKQLQLQKFKKQVEISFGQQSLAIDLLKKQMNSLTVSLEEKKQVRQTLQIKLLNSQKQQQSAFKKIYAKLDGIGIQDHAKFKPCPDNDLSNYIYNLISILIKWEPGKLKKIPITKLQNVTQQKQIRSDKNKQLIRKILNAWKNNKKKYQKMGIVFMILIEWIQAVDLHLFKNQQEQQKGQKMCQKLNIEITEIEGQMHKIKQKMIQKEQNIKICQQTIAGLKGDENLLNQKVTSLTMRKERIQIIIAAMSENQHKIKISKDLAERLYFIPKIIMSKSISRVSLNEYDDDDFIARELFLRSTQKQENKEISEADLFKYDVPLFQNIFDDFDAVLQMYHKYNLHELDYDQVKLINTVVTSNQRVQLIEDAYDIIAPALFDICGNYLGYKILDLVDAREEVVRKQIMSRAANHNKILIRLSRFEKESETKHLINLIVDAIKESETLKIVAVFKKFESTYQTDRFRWVTDGRVCLTFRRYLKQFVKVIDDRQYCNEWEYYTCQNNYNKLHKKLFQVVQKFQSDSEVSFNNILAIIKQLQEAQVIRTQAYQMFDQYYEHLTTISMSFTPFYILLKFIEGVERVNPIDVFEEDNLLKNCLTALKKAAAELYGINCTDINELFKKFLVYLSNQINFLDRQQVVQFCMIGAFLMSKPGSITPYFINRILRKVGEFKKDAQKIRYLVQEVHGKQIGYSKIDQLIHAKSFTAICDSWLQYLIFAISNNFKSYEESFFQKVKLSNFSGIISCIMQRTTGDLHYYISKAKLDFKNEFKISVTTCRQRACKYFWVIKVRKEHTQKFMQTLESKISCMKEQIKLVNFFFNQNKYESSISKLKQLSEKKMFVCIFNLKKQKNTIIQHIIAHLQQKSKNMHQMFKIFILTEEYFILKNRQYIDFISFVLSQETSQQIMQKSTKDEVSKVMKENSGHQQKLQQNLILVNSLNVIVEKCSKKMKIFKQKDKIYKFLLAQLLNQKIIRKQGSVMKFLYQYFKVFKIEMSEFQTFCKMKQSLLFCEQRKNDTIQSVEPEVHNDSIQKWVFMLKKFESCTTIAPKYSRIIGQEIERMIQCMLKGVPVPVIINEVQLKNALKYGWMIIENANMLKFLLYKGLKEGLRELQYQDSCEVIRELKLVCEKGTHIFAFKLDEFNELFDNQDVVKQIELQVKVIQESCEEFLLDKSEIQSILQRYNIRMNLCGEKHTLGNLFVTFK